MAYDRLILEILTMSGEKGLTPKKISLHVYNSTNSLFAEADYEQISRSVSAWLKRNSTASDSLVEKTGQRGHYRLNMNSAQARQLMLTFSDAEEDEESGKNDENLDLSLSLFD